MIRLLQGDCLDLLGSIPNGSIDMVLADLPYGTTACKWDSIIPFEPLWQHFKRICNGAIVLTSSQPFTSLLVCSNLGAFKYETIWEKDKPSDFACAKFRTMKYHESILIFSFGREVYNPQMEQGEPNHSVGKGIRAKSNDSGANTKVVTNKIDGLKHPKSVKKWNREAKPVHPTQKPVALMEYLIKTYTNEGDTVLDNTMGSGTTGIACINTNRHFIGMEKDPDIFAVAHKRIRDHELQAL